MKLYTSSREITFRSIERSIQMKLMETEEFLLKNTVALRETRKSL